MPKSICTATHPSCTFGYWPQEENHSSGGHWPQRERHVGENEMQPRVWRRAAWPTHTPVTMKYAGISELVLSSVTQDEAAQPNVLELREELGVDSGACDSRSWTGCCRIAFLTHPWFLAPCNHIYPRWLGSKGSSLLNGAQFFNLSSLFPLLSFHSSHR